MIPWRGDVPVGAMAAATEGLRAALPRIAERLDLPVPADRRWRWLAGRQMDLDLHRYRVDDPVRLDDVDAISGGAITNSALFALLRMPGISGTVRVIEHDTFAISNLNRYPLARALMLTWPKAVVLETFGTAGIRITGREVRLDVATLAGLEPMAPRLLVGVDHIPSRWLAQRAAGPGWVASGPAPTTSSSCPPNRQARRMPGPRTCRRRLQRGHPDHLVRVVLGRPDPGAGTRRRSGWSGTRLDSVHRDLAVRAGQPAWAPPVPAGPVAGCPVRCTASTLRRAV